jgi:hypothetical protein
MMDNLNMTKFFLQFDPEFVEVRSYGFLFSAKIEQQMIKKRLDRIIFTRLISISLTNAQTFLAVLEISNETF